MSALTLGDVSVFGSNFNSCYGLSRKQGSSEGFGARSQ
jgi:hypothetical protein